MSSKCFYLPKPIEPIERFKPFEHNNKQQTINTKQYTINNKQPFELFKPLKHHSFTNAG